MMKHSRKEFLKLSAGVAGSIALSPAIKQLMQNDDAGKLKTFGLQLYTIRDVFEKDPKGTLQQISTLGYKQLEGYERSSGIFWGMTNLEFKKYMDDLGMRFISSHCDTDKDFKRKASEAAAIGMKYLIHAWEGPGRTIDDYKKYAEDFNRKGELCKKNGIRFAFHNHSFSFKKVADEFPQDILLNNTDASLVDFEMDIYWVAAVGQDPEAWLNKYPNRFRLCHIKDRVKGSTKLEDTCDLGTGSIDFSKILKTAKQNGMQYYIVEQEHYPNSTPLKSAEADAEYMRRLKI
ncbi:MAG TPA: sugar phosphate isomerase/epimerase [Chitinophagaceae bacterium]|nr:sugar phosphate isomerase/epimerase [Chitinophagaceae bacterium]